LGTEDLLVTKENGILGITLNRPDKLNAMTMEMKTGIIQALSDAENDNTVLTVIITGAGRAFCAGVDLSVFGEMTTNALIADQKIIKDMILALVNLSKPVIAAINGAAVGVGFSLALACDIIIASENARFGGVWVRRGLHPDGGASWLLPRRIGTGKALELLLTGRIIPAAEAAAIGLANQVTTQEELGNATREMARQLSLGAPMAKAMTKASVYQGFGMDIATMMDHETRAQGILSFTEDCQEALSAFSEKRNPVFKWS